MQEEKELLYVTGKIIFMDDSMRWFTVVANESHLYHVQCIEPISLSKGQRVAVRGEPYPYIDEDIFMKINNARVRLLS